MIFHQAPGLKVGWYGIPPSQNTIYKRRKNALGTYRFVFGCMILRKIIKFVVRF